MSQKREKRNTKAFKKVAIQATRGSPLVASMCKLAIAAGEDMRPDHDITENSPSLLLSVAVRGFLDRGQENIITRSIESLADSGDLLPAMLLDGLADAQSNVITIDENIIGSSGTDEEEITDIHLFVVPIVLHYAPSGSINANPYINSIELRECLIDNNLLCTDDSLDVVVSTSLYSVNDLPSSFVDRRRLITAIAEHQEATIASAKSPANMMLRFIVFTLKGPVNTLDNCDIINPFLLMETAESDAGPNDLENIYAANLTNLADDVAAVMQQNNPDIISAFVSFPAYLREGISAGVNMWNTINLGVVLDTFNDQPERAFLDFAEDGSAYAIHIAIHSKAMHVDTKWVLLEADFEDASELITGLLKDAGVTDIYLPMDTGEAVEQAPKGMRLH